MLAFRVNKKKGGFRIDFDIPLTPQIQNNEEFVSFSGFFAGEKNCAFDYNYKKEITGLRGDLDSLANVLERMLSPKEAQSEKEFLDHLLEMEIVHRKGLDVNFHQKPFDTPGRYWNFILNQGCFPAYFINRIHWWVGPKNGCITPFPLHVDLESASTCNMNCPMCYRDLLKEMGQMDFDLFKKAVNECADHNVFSIRLSWRGETLTHPRIREMIAYATSRIRNVSFLTNAFYIDEAMADCFIENRVSYVAVSFDGMGAVYESLRHPARFEESRQRLAMLKSKREKAGRRLPQIRLCTILPAIKNDPEAYYQAMKDVSDYIVCNPYINFRGAMQIKPDFICQYPWERMVVGFNGNAQCCTGWNADDIILGNITHRSLYEMWHGKLMNDIRKTHLEGRRMELSSCARCRHGSETDPDIDISDVIKRGF